MAHGKTAEEIIQAIEASKAYPMKAAELLHISRATFYNYLNRYSTAKAAYEEARQKRHEWVESKLLKQIEKDNLTAIIFYLKTQCKHMGYVERQEVTGADAGPLTVKVVYDE